MFEGIKDVNDEDLILSSDLDEIPDLKSFKFKNKITLFQQNVFYYKFNLMQPNFKWMGTRACKKKQLKEFQWLRNIKSKSYPFWRVDTLFSNLKHMNLQIVEDGGWHFTNIKTAKDIYTKLSNFGHHNEFDVSGISVEDIQKCIDNKIVNYNHQADMSVKNKYNANYKLKLIEDKNLPNYLIKNKQKYKDWFSNS